MPAWLISLGASLGQGIIWLLGQISLGLFIYDEARNRQLKQEAKDAQASEVRNDAISHLPDDDLDDIVR